LWLRILLPPFSETGKPEKFGVDDAQIDRAIRSLEEAHRTKDKEQHLWQKFKAYCATSVAALILCFIINIFTGMAAFWSGYVASALGLFLLGHYAGVRFAPESVEMTLERSSGFARNYYEDQHMDDKIWRSTSGIVRAF
jgi:hypothetical protein